MTKRISLVVFALMVATGSLVTQVRTLAQASDTQVSEFFKAYDAAFNARDIVKLATMYHKDVTIFEGAGINNGWADYRDNHLGPELTSFQDLQWAHVNIVVHSLGATAAYVTANYTIKYKSGERVVDSGGIATHVLVKEDGQWKIRHSMTATRRRAPGVAVDPDVPEGAKNLKGGAAIVWKVKQRFADGTARDWTANTTLAAAGH